MEINLGEQRIVELQATFSAEQIHGLALSKRVDAFGQMAKLFQRPKPEEIEITEVQKRLEPFWFAAASARYAYDRRQTYRVNVAPQVQGVSVLGNDLTIVDDRNRGFELQGVEHCVEEMHREVTFDATRGDEVDLSKYLKYPTAEVEDLGLLEKDGTLVVPPAVLGSFIMRKLVTTLMKTFQADRIDEERIDVEELTLFYRPVYAAQYFWKSKDKRQILEFDALTEEFKSEGTQLKKHVNKVLANDALFDIGIETIGMVVPGAKLAIKVSRLAARKALR